MDEQQPRPLPTPPGCRPLPAGQPASRTPVARGHRRADSLPFTFPSAPLVKHSCPAIRRSGRTGNSCSGSNSS
jgi:hypothetical protein